MSNAVNVNFRMDAELKRNMEELCDDLGMSMTTAFTIFAKRMTRERRIPFDVSADRFYSESNMRYLNGIANDVREGRAHFTEHALLEMKIRELSLGGQSLGGLSVLAGAG